MLVCVVQILALTLLHIHTLPGGPLSLLCSRSREGGGPTPPPRAFPHADTPLLRDCDGLLLPLSPSPSFSLSRMAGELVALA